MGTLRIEPERNGLSLGSDIPRSTSKSPFRLGEPRLRMAPQNPPRSPRPGVPSEQGERHWSVLGARIPRKLLDADRLRAVGWLLVALTSGTGQLGPARSQKKCQATSLAPVRVLRRAGAHRPHPAAA